MTDHYTTLGVDRQADTATIKSAFRRASRQAHPDKEGGSDAAQAAVNEAWRVLSDPELRKLYDETGSAERELTQEEKLRKEAWKRLVGLFANAIVDPNGDDPVALTRDSIRENVAEMRKIMAGLPSAVIKVEMRMARLRRRTEGENMLLGVAQQQLDRMKTRVENLGVEVEIAERMLDMLDEYSSSDEATRSSFFAMGVLAQSVVRHPRGALKIDMTGGM